ncbi:MAG: YihY/virulence factor BrkB family protein [Bdellovibrionaceae bacterium]|nr:YihY/virulence factor BrkB family protein [Pseudobdellovibrionaceae bacterium]
MPKYKNFFVLLTQKITEDELFTRSAAVAYSASLALAPTIMLMVSILGLVQMNLVYHLAIQTNRLIGYEVGELVLRLADYSKEHVRFASLSGLLGVSILIVSGSFLFTQVEDTMKHIFKNLIQPCPSLKSRHYTSYLRQLLLDKIFSILIFVTGIAIAMVSLFLSFLLSNTLGHYSPLIYGIIYEISTFLIFALLFYMIYRCTPAKCIHNRSIIVGSFITSALFLAGKELIAIYISFSRFGSIYGAAGSIVVFLIWVYYSSLTVFLGAEIISVHTTLKSK